MDIKYLKKWGIYIFSLSLIAMVQSACIKKTSATASHLESTLKRVFTKFSAEHLSYLVCENGNPVGEKSDDQPSDNIAELNKKAFISLSAPLELDHYFRDSIINGEDTLNKTFKNIRNSNIKYRDLLLIPADHFEPKSFDEDSVAMMINKIIMSQAHAKKKVRDSSIYFQKEFGIKDLKENNFRKLSSLSDYLIKSHPEYRKSQDTVITDLFPTWYAENKSLLFGWKIFRLKNKIILWNFFHKGDSGLLLLRFMDQNIFVSASYTSKDMPNPYSFNREDLLQSPIAVALIKDVLFPGDKNNYDAFSSDGWARQIKGIKNDDLRLLKVKELIAEARYFQHIGSKVSARSLFEGLLTITEDSLLTHYINENAVADIGYVSNNLNTSAEFTVEKDGYYQIFAGGQVAAINDFNATPYQYDNIQLYFNDQVSGLTMKKEKIKLFHFNYRFNKIAGMQDDRHQDSWLKASKIQFAYDDPDVTLYTLEVAIPWNEIRSDGQTKPLKLGMNILIGDSDYTENQRESILSWATKPGEDWSNPSTFGNLLLTPPPSEEKHKIYSKKIQTPLIIDGKQDEIWEGVKNEAILYPYYGTVSPRDNSATFKSLWDEKNLYFLFSVIDNCKNRTGLITRDKCWIEDLSTGELIWKLAAEGDLYFPSHSTAQKLYLKSGRYALRYLSDNKHSNEGWVGNAPRNFVYGGIIYKAIKN